MGHSRPASDNDTDTEQQGSAGSCPANVAGVEQAEVGQLGTDPPFFLVLRTMSLLHCGHFLMGSGVVG